MNKNELVLNGETGKTIRHQNTLKAIVYLATLLGLGIINGIIIYWLFHFQNMSSILQNFMFVKLTTNTTLIGWLVKRTSNTFTKTTKDFIELKELQIKIAQKNKKEEEK